MKKENNSLSNVVEKIGYAVASPFVYIGLMFSCVLGAITNPIWSHLHKKQINNGVQNHKLIESNKTIANQFQDWSLNLVLLKDALNRSTSDAEKREINFLAVNYLNKSAPIQLDSWKNYFLNSSQGKDILNNHFQINPFQEYWYHRESLGSKIDIGKDLNKFLAFGEQTPFIPTDSVNFSHFFPLKYTLLPPLNQLWQQKIFEALKNHFTSDCSDPFSTRFSSPILCDITAEFGDKLYTGGDPIRETLFHSDLEKYKAAIAIALEGAIDSLIDSNPALGRNRNRIFSFAKENITCISRVEKEGSKGLKMLPLFSELNSKSPCIEEMIEFFHLTGIYINAIDFRKNYLNAFDGNEELHYCVKWKEKFANAIYYPKKDSFAKSALFQRLFALYDYADSKIRNSLSPSKVEKNIKAFGIPQHDFDARAAELAKKPHIVVLGKGTMNLLNGLFEEITSDRWDELNNHATFGPIFQFSVMMIKNYLAKSEMAAMSNNFAEFAQQIELVHAEIATLLHLMKPYSQGDFKEIYRKEISSMIPDELQASVKCGLGKTAMNIFAGINYAVMQNAPTPTRLYGDNIYFEELSIVGEDHNFDHFRKDLKASPVDLYIGQFNPNINTTPELSTYEFDDVSDKVQYLLSSNRASNHLTVAIDCTIEQSQSKNITSILNTFKTEINSGLLNFVFFKSGQKYDMFGMDNYYGAPFFTVNNGAKQWNAFNDLLDHEVHKADELSHQWFCLSNKYASDSLAEYKHLIFKNTREILDQVPESLKPNGKIGQSLKINSASRNIDTAFIDFKLQGIFRKPHSWKLMELFYQTMSQNLHKVYSRQSFGFYHPSILVFDLPDSLEASTIRLTPGINPEENKNIVEFLNTIVDLSGNLQEKSFDP